MTAATQQPRSLSLRNRILWRGLGVLGILIFVQVATWAIWGRGSLLDQLPTMIEYEHALIHEWATKRGLEKVEDPPTSYVVIPSDVEHRLGQVRTEALENAFAQHGVHVHLESEAPSRFVRDFAGRPVCDGCSTFGFALRWNTPILAKVETNYPGGLGGFGIDHDYMWCLGFWVHIRSWQSWVS